MGEYMVWVWLALLVLFIITEVATVQLTTIWFAGGALTAMLLAAFGMDNIAIQTIVFFAVSIILLFVTRPLVKKHITTKAQPTNADRCIGQPAVVTEEINNLIGKGSAKVGSTEWTARSLSGEIIPKDTVVTVARIEGVKLIVE